MKLKTIKKTEKGGLLFVPLIVIGVIFIVAAILGIVFIKKATDSFTGMIDNIGTTKIIIFLVIVFAIIFHKFVEAALMTILGWIKR